MKLNKIGEFWNSANRLLSDFLGEFCYHGNVTEWLLSVRLKVLWVDARNQWDFGILKITLLKVKQGNFETAVLILPIFLSFVTAKGVKKQNIEISVWFKSWVQWCSCLRVHILVWVLLQDISQWPNLAIANGITRAFHNLWVLFHLL